MAVYVRTSGGGEEAWEGAVRRVRGKLVRFAEGMVGGADGEDVVQVALEKAWRLRKGGRRDEEGWLFRCVANAGKDWLRARRKGPEVLSVDAILEDDA